MWRDSSASTSMAKPNAWGTSEISRRSQFNNSEVQSPSASNNTNGGHIPSSNASSSINSGVPPTDDWKIGRIFTTEDMTERVLFGKSGLEGAMERLTVVSVNLNCGQFSLFIGLLLNFKKCLFLLLGPAYGRLASPNSINRYFLKMRK